MIVVVVGAPVISKALLFALTKPDPSAFSV